MLIMMWNICLTYLQEIPPLAIIYGCNVDSKYDLTDAQKKDLVDKMKFMPIDTTVYGNYLRRDINTGELSNYRRVA